MASEFKSSASAGRYDPREIKARLAFLDLLAHEGLSPRRSGPGRFVMVCPFHQERSGSFTIYAENDRALDHAHCFGCGWNGDVIKFWKDRHGGDFWDVCTALASLAHVSPAVFEAKRKSASQMSRMTRTADRGREKPALPAMRRLAVFEMQELAAVRGLSFDGVWRAAEAGRVGFCEWPQWERRKEEVRIKNYERGGSDSYFFLPPSAFPCWVVTDRSRNVAQFRRLDGGRFTRKDGQEIKAWTKGSPTWPVGAAELADVGAVLLVEGGADMLAAYHFLEVFGRLMSVGVVAMLGASCAIAADALAYFKGKRVRIIMHVDAPAETEEELIRKPGIASLPGKEEKTGDHAREGSGPEGGQAGEGSQQASGSERSQAVPLPGFMASEFNPSGVLKKRAGLEASARWTEQLTGAGAAVECFSLEGLARASGEAVGDLNDLALCGEETWRAPEVREAFFDFDF